VTRCAAANREARGPLPGHLAAVVVLGRELDIFVRWAVVGTLIFDAYVRELHVPVIARQAVLRRPLRNLFRRSIGSPGRISLAAIVRLQELLVVALQFVIEDDSADARAALVEPLGGFLVRSNSCES
jgi:hypothetical protein